MRASLATVAIASLGTISLIKTTPRRISSSVAVTTSARADASIRATVGAANGCAGISIASTGASIKEIVHDRAFSGPDMSAVREAAAEARALEPSDVIAIPYNEVRKVFDIVRRALQAAGKSFDVQVGPDRGHSPMNQDRMMEFFIDALRPEASER